MSGLDKIVNTITEEGQLSARDILSRAEAQAETIINDGKAKTFSECERIAQKADLEAGVIAERAAASAELKKKQILLAGKQELIKETIEKTYQTIDEMSDGDYVELIRRIFAGHIPDAPACLKLNSRDKQRIPSEVLDDFVSLTSQKGGTLTISEEAADIPNGFVLDFGGIEENCSLNALIEQNREDIEDRINNKLWA